MSNKQVPAVYRQIMSSVVDSVRSDFDEVGVDEAVLNELLRSWETKMATSRTADWTQDERVKELAKGYPPMPTPGAATASTSAPILAVKKEEQDSSPAAADSKATSKASSTAGNGKAAATGGADGGDDDEINSDLDDPEEDDAEDEEEGGDLVIALYEKVHRVKNKWKITLKDGLVSVGGKDYLFAKCQGEFEWF